jgi:uncharacterized glyoxalase superfamily protein PhnB
MKAKFIGLTPMLRTADIKTTIEFYENVLGFVCSSYNEEWGWASLNRESIVIMIASPDAHEIWERASFTGSIYITVENVAEYWQEVKDKTRVCYPLETFEYGMKEFAVYDNDGYPLQFGEEIAGK